MKLKEIREKNRYKQQDIAKLLNMTKSGYGFYESGRSEPNIKTLIKLADFYHITIDELVGRENSNIIDKGTLDEIDLDIIDKLLKLDKDNKNRLQAYTYALWENQQNEDRIIKKIKGEI